MEQSKTLDQICTKKGFKPNKIYLFNTKLIK